MARNQRTSRRSHQGVSPPANRTLIFSLLGGIGIWLAFPPAGLWWLAWIAPWAWVRLITMPQLTGERPWRAIYFGGYIHWLLMIQWVRLPHWATSIGWLILAAYLALFVVAFIALGRVLVHRARITSLVAVPVAWVATEYVRSTAFTGFPLVPLSNSQFQQIALVQISGVTGAYGVSFLIMFFVAAVEHTVRPTAHALRPSMRWSVLATPVVTVALVIMYGVSQLKPVETVDVEQVSVAIVQGSLDTVFPATKEEQLKVAKQHDKAFREYYEMSLRASRSLNADLVLWPESMFRDGAREYSDRLATVPVTVDLTYAELSAEWNDSAANTIRSIGTQCLVGTETIRFETENDSYRYNSAVLYAADGARLGSYHKMHPVMFGEYIPFGDVFPSLYRLTPISSPLTPGRQPQSFPVGDVWFAPNICFENMVPQLIGRQLRELHRKEVPVDVLVTLTNDGWFWGSSLLDVHLACGVFRAVEHRKPVLIAANTGFSAHVDQRGRVLQQGPRRASGVLLAAVSGSDRSLTLYTKWGDWFAGLCAVVSTVGVVIALRAKRTAGATAGTDTTCEHALAQA